MKRNEVILAGAMTIALLLSPLVILGAPDSSALSGDELKQMLVGLEKQSWVAWKAHDARFFEDFLSDDHVEVGPRGLTNKAALVTGVGSPVCKVDSYSVDAFRFTRVADDTAVLNYRAKQKTTCGSVSIPSPARATSVYVKRDGKWLNVLYQQTPVVGN